MKIKINSQSTTGATFAVTYNSEECHASVKFKKRKGVIQLGTPNKRCETIAEALDLVRCLEANASTSHLDIY